MSGNKGNFVRPPSRGGIKDPRNATFVVKLADLEKQREKSRPPVPPRNETMTIGMDDVEEMTGTGAGPRPVEAPPPPASESRTIAVFAPKGGVGATTLAINIAGTLARLGRPVVLVDLDLQLGAVPVSLNVRPERSLAEICREAEKSPGALQTGLDRHGSGLSFLAQGDRIEEIAEVTAERLPRLFDALSRTFPYVVVDGMRDFGDHAVTSMDLAHLVLLVVTQDVPAVRAAGRALRLFRRLGFGPDRVRIVVNRFVKNAPVTLDAIQNALGQPVEAVVHNDFPLVERALNLGSLLADVKPGARATRDIEALTHHYAGIPDAPVAAGGFFSRLLGGR